VALSGVVLGSALAAGWPVAGAVAGSLAVGTACGVSNGLLVAGGRLPPFIATLGTMSVGRGLALMAAQGRPISGFSDGFRLLATGRPLMVPAPVAVAGALCAVAHLVLTRTVFGREVFAIGGNEEASRLSGVPVRARKVTVYAAAGLASGAAAVVLTARLNSAQPTAGLMYELDAIAAAVIGGTSLLGGEGSMAGTVTGALIMGVLRNGLNLVGVSAFVQQVVVGGVIIGAVLLDSALKRSRG
jgi:ribose/xylose/arabinose/galactoside ABC-type transport system permease subunit